MGDTRILLEVPRNELDQLGDHGMKQFVTPDGEILLIKEKGNYFAIGAKCSHYGAPLSKGVLSKGRIRCPWHGACFDVQTGDIEDYPGLDSLPKFDVTIVDGRIVVKGTRDSLMRHKRRKCIMTDIISLDESVVIVGGGPAAETCLETLRFNGFNGRIILVSSEKHLPYDRTKLSKNMDSPVCSIFLRSYTYYEDGQIELLLNREVVRVDFSERLVSFASGGDVRFKKLVFATGTKPRPLCLPGNQYENIFYLRSPEDAHKISENATNKKVVIIGNSFIGMETAAYLVTKVSEVTVIGRSSVPYEKALGKLVGERLQKFFEEKGVKFKGSCVPVKFVGEDGKVSGIQLEDEILNCDVCIVGIGVMPATEFLKGSEIKLNENGYIEVDEYLSTNIDCVYACGDVTSFPLFCKNNDKVSIGHFQMAQSHGKTVALSIHGTSQPIKSVPFFWTAFFGKSLRFSGYNVGHDTVILQGNLEDLVFAVFYCVGDSVVAVATMNMDPLAAEFAELIHQQVTIKSSMLKEDPNYLKQLCKIHLVNNGA